MMGIILLKRENEIRHQGESYGTDILYVYCDECGSFSITTYISSHKWLIVIVCFLLAFGLIASVSAGSNVMICTPICIGIGWALIKFGWGDINYQCRKCGNTSIIINDPKDLASRIPNYNTLKYPSIMEVLDVPDNLTQKRYQGYWDADYQ